MNRAVDALDVALDAVGDRAHDTGQPAAAGEDPALHVDGVRTTRLAEARTLGAIVDEHVGAEHGRRAPAAHAEAGALPESHAARVDDPRRVEHVADAQVVAQSTREAERDELRIGHACRGADTDPRGAQADPARDALLSGRGYGKRQPVSVHARLRTVSLRLFEASYAADGSNPQWMPQCSQRGSFPGPYASHSIPSSSASYVGKMPSVSR